MSKGAANAAARGSGRGVDAGAGSDDDEAAVRADGGWHSAVGGGPGLARPREAAPGAPSVWTATWDARGAWRLDAAAQHKDAGGAAPPRSRPPDPDAGRHRDTAWRVLRGGTAGADGSTSDSGSDGARAVPAPDHIPGEDAALPAQRRRRRRSDAKRDDSDSDRSRRPRRRRVAERKE